MSSGSPDNLPPYHPPPDLQCAVDIAIGLFAKSYSPACHDRHEWWCDCQQEAWLAVLQSAPRYRLPDPPPAHPEAHYVMWLAGKALKRLKRYWRQEKRYYGQVMPIWKENEAGEEEELEFVDEGAQAQVEEVLQRVLFTQVLEQLSPRLDEKDWMILEGMLTGRTQVDIAQETGFSQPAVSKRWHRICQLVREILGESG